MDKRIIWTSITPGTFVANGAQVPLYFEFNEMKQIIEDQQEIINKLSEKVEEIELALKFLPGGPMFQQVKEEFNNLSQVQK